MTGKRVRDSSAAQHAAELAQFMQQTRKSVSHGLGHYKGYTFRIGRAPMQPGTRRPPNLRVRPKPRPLAQDINGENSNIDDVNLRTAEEMEDDQEGGRLRRPPPVEEIIDKVEKQYDNLPPPPPAKRLKVSVPPSPPKTQPLSARLQQSGWPGAEVLWGQQQAQAGIQLLVMAFAACLLEAGRPRSARPAYAGPSTPLIMAASAQMLKRKGDDVLQPLSTLALVKQVAISAQATRKGATVRSAPTEEQISANVLLIVQLLNASRPRTAMQCKRAISQLEMLNLSSARQGIRA